MKSIYYFLAGVVSFSPLTSLGTENAQATTFCYSLQFQQGIDPNENYYLDLTSLSGSLNGELGPDFFASGYTHSTYLRLADEVLGDTLSGKMVLDVPTGGDANGDGFPDFFQVTQGVTNLASSGVYFDLEIHGNSRVTALWNRPAGSSYGTCVLSMQLMPFQPVSFSHTFEVLEYRGRLTYTPTTNVTGSLSLVRTGNPADSLNGPIQFAKSPTDRFNELSLQAGVWTNESQQAVSYVDNTFTRDKEWPTNYYGYLEFTDNANPGAFYPYALWMLSIDDSNDSNHNSIPDFSDDPTLALPRAPRLELAQTTTNLMITLHGDVGHVHEIQELSDLLPNTWQTAVSVTLTNDPQKVSIPLPAEEATFWRARAK
jgi:hypothetical protein